MDDLHLIVGKICHDLASPLGSIRNGMEMYDDIPECREEALTGVREQAEAAIKLLRFFRTVFATDNAASVPVAEWSDLTFGKAVLTLHGLPAALSGALTRVLLLQVRAAADLLPRGGEVAVTLHENGLTVTAAGTPLLTPRPLQENDLQSRDVWPYAAARAAERADIYIDLQPEAPRLHFLITGPGVDAGLR